MRMEIGGPIGLLILIADVYAIIKTVESHASTTAKVLWVLGIIIFPIIGVLAWLLFGPRNLREA